jgi:AcrR family transcriptional regulator
MQAQKTERAERILAAADTLFSERGFDGVSIRDVAERAGVAKALVFYRFTNKEVLFERVIDRYYVAHRGALDAAFSAGGSLRERFHGVLDAYLDFIVEHDRYPRLIQAQIASGRQTALVEANLGMFYAWTQEALAGIAPAEGPTAARQLFLTFSAAVIHYFTYAPVLVGVWGADPLAEAGLSERRAHLHWLVDLVIDKLEADRGS